MIMPNTWTREQIIHHILAREAEGRALTTGRNGVDPLVYAAGRRIFGSWRNAILAAGIPPRRALNADRWSPPSILAMIRRLSHQRQPVTAVQPNERYDNLVSAARRHYGSWRNAVLASGVNPITLQRAVYWNRERVIEAILMRALRGDSVVARLVKPRSLVEAGHRLFGHWREAVSAAGLDPHLTMMPPRRAKTGRRSPLTTQAADASRLRYRRWSKELLVESILARIREGKPVHASAVARDQANLYQAAIRHLKTWDDVLRTAGLDPAAHRPPPRKVALGTGSALGKSHHMDTMRRVRDG